MPRAAEHRLARRALSFLAFLAIWASLVAATLPLALLACAPSPQAPAVHTTLIAGALVVDGSGAPGYTADVRLLGDRVGEIGELAPRPSEPVVDGRGLVLAPGFIDPHSHADSAILDHRDALAAVSQGITTVIGGQDGESELPLASLFARLEAEPAAVNLASYVGHGTLRRKAMGDDFERPATGEEVERMRELLATEMTSGALGLASGLEYDPGIYSTTDEVVALAREAAAHGGRYISHIRSEDRHFWEAIDEILTIAREAEIPVQISHLKLALRSLHGQAERLLALLDAARAAGVEVTADIYPYTYWQSTLTVMFPDRDFEDPAAARFAVEELAAPEDMLIPVFAPEPALAGKTLAEIAEQRGADAAATLIELIREAAAMRRERTSATGGGQDPDDEDLEPIESVIAVSMAEADIERLMRWPFISICTDGELDGAHPRGFGSFPRVLGRYVRERGALTLEQAVHRMTGRTADSLGLAHRGRIATGSFADLVLFDPQRVIDRATTDDPHAVSKGVVAVWVNGQPVFELRRPTDHRPGRVLRRQ